ncbi:MAG: hypothetical protein A3H37_09040 [Candidatus Schekmanbacteria bacterium RIFCSPLOWO2_02_FULL_38_14]|uniref:Glycosyltransferase 2-like domain-containing protein n=1 Tax=Candidatus Schekmanbacteria bacterium RIFCSPLOWO2_12_FULL_38_15 TaxID=1817883 RepID=A0A1F7SPL8_9BACT|nr:MAG: hypothetical protein A3H37_09040 [Candidatus Schekmanbacteria bacterium RIFCSPLOWO2_02_FULL_38_14]OGL55158.1 MAG: hypothetical protein A3G31_02865 [Candidatus Schekmanbacteria bacterium RIFCSPLOWO2_12_FULL_38_15]
MSVPTVSSKVSIVIPTYNCAQYIGETIESILNQIYKNFEIIVVDDGSTDNTRDVAKSFEKEINYIYQENGGPSKAKNTGIKAARGEYIAFLDADDIWFPDILKQTVQAFQQYAEAGLAFTDYLKFDESGVIQQSNCADRFKVWFNKHRSATTDLAYGWFYRELLIGSCISSVFVKKKVMEEVGMFDETFKIGEDYDLWLRIAKKYKFIYINRVLYKYRYRLDSLSGATDVRRFRWGHANIRVFEKHLVNNWVPRELQGLVKEVLSQRCWSLGWSYFSQNLFKESRLLFFRGICYQFFNWKNWLFWGASFLPLTIIEMIRQIRHSLR